MKSKNYSTIAISSILVFTRDELDIIFYLVIV